MTAVYPTTTVEVELSGVGSGWTDISVDVIPPVSGFLGIPGNKPLDRIGKPATLEFRLNNSITNSGRKNGYYSPGHTDARSGFDAGIGCRIKFVYEAYTKYRIKGNIVLGGIVPEPGSRGKRVTLVTVHGWMKKAMKHKMDLPTLAEDKTTDEIAALIVANMPSAIQPTNTDYNTGDTTSATVFDMLKKTSTAYAEFYKIALSELGYIYDKGDTTDGQTFVVDGRNTRAEQTTVKQLTVGKGSSGFLLKEDGAYLLKEDGYRILIDEVQDATLTAIMDMSSPPRGRDVCNTITTKTYPRRIDAAATTVLWTLNKYIEIEAGITKEPFKAYFRDPDNLATSVGAKDVQDLIETTDYLMNAKSDGSGADLSSDLTVTLEKTGSNGVEITLANSGAVTGYVTFLQVKGKGIYTYEPVEFTISDSASIDQYGPIELRVDLKYVDQPLFGETIGSILLAEYKDAKSLPNELWYNANRSDLYLYAFLQLEPGDRFYSNEDQTGIGDDYIVNGMKFEILENSIINFGIIPAVFSSNADKWYLGVSGSSELGVTTKLGII